MSRPPATKPTLRDISSALAAEEATLRKVSKAATERAHKLNRLTARERIARLLDDPNDFFELGIWAGHKMYSDWGDTPAAGIISGIGHVSGQPCMIAANDASVKAGAFFPQTAKKVIRT